MTDINEIVREQVKRCQRDLALLGKRYQKESYLARKFSAWLDGCGCKATKFGFARMCDSCYANVTKELREQIAQEQKEYLDHWQDFYQDFYLATYSDDITDCVGRDLIAITRGEK